MVKRKLHVRFRRWVDRDILHSTRPASMFLPLVPVIFGAIAFARESAGWWLGMIGGAAVFIWWLGRVFHIMRVVSDVAGRGYERDTRFKLPPEYANSLSARRARFRRARDRKSTWRP